MKSGYFRCRPIHKTEECRDSTLHHMFLVPGQERSRVGGSRTLIHPPANGMSTPLLIPAQIPQVETLITLKCRPIDIM